MSAELLQEFELFHAVMAFRRIGASPGADAFQTDSRFVNHVSRVYQFACEETVAKDPRALSDMAWSCARLCIAHEPLLDAIAAEALTRLSEFDP